MREHIFAYVTMANTTLFDADDQRYRITPSQQMLCSCLGALTTSTLGNEVYFKIAFTIASCF